MEIWKTITDYPNYQVSNYGNIKNIRFNRILKCTITPYGYKVCSLGKNKFYKSYFVHRLVASAFVDNPNNYPCVNHKDENKLNNNSNNLEWCTQTYNHNYGNAIEKQTKSRREIVVAIKDDICIIARSGKDLKRYLKVKAAPHYAIVRVYKYYGYNVRFGYSNDKIKLKDNIIVKIKNNIVVETIK